MQRVKKDAFELTALRPTRIAVISYAIIKQFFFTFFMSSDVAIGRLVASVIMISLVFIITSYRRLKKRHLSILLLSTIVLSEMIYLYIFGGDRMIFMFLIGLSLLGIIYNDIKVMIIMMVLSCSTIVILSFGLGVNMVGTEYDTMQEIYSVVGLFFINILIIFIGKITIGSLARAREKAEEASKSKSNFLASISHEIRTPMNAIIGIAQIQLMKEDLPDEHARALEKIYNAGSNLLGIINDLLDMSKIESGKLELNPVEYDTPSLINDAVQTNIVRIGSKPIEFKLNLDENLPSRLYGDELRIKQILNNLLSNAIKYTDKGSVVLRIHHLTEEDGITLCFKVEDSGQGMRRDELQKLFTEYMRFNTEANRTTEGTGLGLSITNRLIQLMDGKISVESEYGKGSTFSVTIKQKAVACGAIGADIARQLSSFSFTGDKLKTSLQFVREPMPYGTVLVVDDVETNLFIAQGLLSLYKLTIETALSGYAAIGKIENGNTYDVIFMDHMMPQMDGMETTRKLREMGYNGVIVALTANALVGNDKLFTENGFDAYVSKPIEAQQLNAVLNKFIRDRHPNEAKNHKPEEETAAEADETKQKLFQIFRRDVEKAIETLRKTAADNDIKLFTITSHAIKSALANMGEIEASKTAFSLENAGLNNDKDFISGNLERFIETLQDIVKGIPTEEIASVGADIEEDTIFFTEQTLIIKNACENYDDATAYAALDRLKEKQWKAETAATLETIRGMLFLHSDFDGVVERINNLTLPAALSPES